MTAIAISVYLILGVASLPTISFIYWRRFPDAEEGPMSALVDVATDQTALLIITIFLWPVFVADALWGRSVK